MATTAPELARVAGRRERPVRLGRTMLSDERLAELVHAGDPTAFSVIYERYRAPLSRYCRSILRQGEDAADALQNTMLAALRALEREPPAGPLRPWLYRIAHNESIDLMRRRERQGPSVADLPERPAADQSEVTEQIQALLSDLRHLPERQRGALLMRELAGLEYDQIGRAFATSTAGARKLVYEARVSLERLAEGQNASCASVCRQLSDGDRRTARGRLVRAHLDICPACAAFAASLVRRREHLALIPALPALAGTGLGVSFVSAAGGAGAGAGKALGGGAVGASALGGGSLVSGLGGAAALKCATVCGALVLAGAGAAIATHVATPHPHSHRALHAAAPSHAGRSAGSAAAAAAAAAAARAAAASGASATGAGHTATRSGAATARATLVGVSSLARPVSAHNGHQHARFVSVSSSAATSGALSPVTGSGHGGSATTGHPHTGTAGAPAPSPAAGGAPATGSGPAPGSGAAAASPTGAPQAGGSASADAPGGPTSAGPYGGGEHPTLGSGYDGAGAPTSAQTPENPITRFSDGITAAVQSSLSAAMQSAATLAGAAMGAGAGSPPPPGSGSQGTSLWGGFFGSGR